MTRVNSDIDPSLLHRRHLVAELREITMVPAALSRALRTKSKDAILKSIPGKFTLNAGHVKFFYDKQKFLINRFNKLIEEMKQRGYTPDPLRVMAFIGFDPEFNNDWESTPEADKIIHNRIAFRIAQKPHLYT